jgi:hypothetical protein
MTRFRATLMAAILFGGVCLMLGTLGAMMIESGRVLSTSALPFSASPHGCPGALLHE